MEEKKIHKTSVGGQALIEGVMMQGPRGIATAVRKTDGDIVVKHHEFSHIRDKHKFFGLPIIRGMVNFAIKCLCMQPKLQVWKTLKMLK